MTRTTATQRSAEQAADKTAIRPFRVNVPETELTELRRRTNATKFPERETVSDATQGVQLATMQALARYWATEYDWRKIEAKLNDLPQFLTEIDGLDIHFIHVRSKHENALPLIVTHGWPGSITEQMKIIEPLTNPTAHGGNASDAFDVVDSLDARLRLLWQADHDRLGPRPHRTRLDRIDEASGYTKFVAQGGDWGGIVNELMGVQAPLELLGIHTNMPNVIPLDINGLAFSGKPAPANLSADEKLAYERLSFVYAKGIGYGFQMGLRPQTLYGIADSPVGLAAYFLDHDARSYEMIARVFAGGTEGLTRDDVLDNVTLTWLTNTALSGARLYWENKGASFFAVKGVVVPTAVSVFPDELYPAPKSWAERASLQQGGEGRPLRGLGTAAALFKRGSCGLQRAPLVGNERHPQGDPMTFETLAIRKEGAALFVEIAAPPMNLFGPELARDLASLIHREFPVSLRDRGH
jgi:hypothetical protein